MYDILHWSLQAIMKGKDIMSPFSGHQAMNYACMMRKHTVFAKFETSTTPLDQMKAA